MPSCAVEGLRGDRDSPLTRREACDRDGHATGGGGSAAFGRRGLGIPCFGDIAACLVDLCGQGPCPVAARADLAGFPPV